MGFRWKLILSLAALFLIGGFCGSALTLGILRSRLHHALHGGRPLEQMLMANLTRQVQLSDEQRAQIKPQIAAAFQQIRALRRDATLKSDDIVDQTLQRIQGQLNPDQQQRLERFRARRRERIKRFLEDSKP